MRMRMMSEAFIAHLVICSSTPTHALKRPSGGMYVPMHQYMWSNVHSTVIQPKISPRFPTAKISMTWVDGGSMYLHASDSHSPDLFDTLKSIWKNYQQTTR